MHLVPAMATVDEAVKPGCSVARDTAASFSDVLRMVVAQNSLNTLERLPGDVGGVSTFHYYASVSNCARSHPRPLQSSLLVGTWRHARLAVYKCACVGRIVQNCIHSPDTRRTPNRLLIVRSPGQLQSAFVQAACEKGDETRFTRRQILLVSLSLFVACGCSLRLTPIITLLPLGLSFIGMAKGPRRAKQWRRYSLIVAAFGFFAYCLPVTVFAFKRYNERMSAHREKYGPAPSEYRAVQSPDSASSSTSSPSSTPSTKSTLPKTKSVELTHAPAQMSVRVPGPVQLVCNHPAAASKDNRACALVRERILDQYRAKDSAFALVPRDPANFMVMVFTGRAHFPADPSPEQVSPLLYGYSHAALQEMNLRSWNGIDAYDLVHVNGIPAIRFTGEVSTGMKVATYVFIREGFIVYLTLAAQDGYSTTEERRHLVDEIANTVQMPNDAVSTRTDLKLASAAKPRSANGYVLYLIARMMGFFLFLLGLSLLALRLLRGVSRKSGRSTPPPENPLARYAAWNFIATSLLPLYLSNRLEQFYLLSTPVAAVLLKDAGLVVAGLFLLAMGLLRLLDPERQRQ